jgi:hypothetical protein
MATFFSITLGISIVGLVLLMALKRYELKSGRVLFGRLRPELDRLGFNSLVIIEHILPRALKISGKRAARALTTLLRTGWMHAMRTVQKMLERILRRVSTSARPQRAGGEVSPFLQQVSEHKRALANEASQERGIFDE